VNTVLPAITGSAAVGSQLTASTGTWTDADNDDLSYSYQWLADNSAITGATSTTYTLTESELGKAIKVRVTANDGNGASASAASSATAKVDSDFDQDGIGDATDEDDDNDGMSDEFENKYGLDPKDPSDADEDLDGDGVSNKDEFDADSDPTKDDYGPEITAPDDITMNARGLFTRVSIGSGTAVDGLDGDVSLKLTAITSNDGDEKAISRAPRHFSPVIHLLTWSSEDSAGNTETAIQTIKINPLVSFSKDQQTSEGSDVLSM
jgi:hypothetical protein